MALVANTSQNLLMLMAGRNGYIRCRDIALRVVTAGWFTILNFAWTNWGGSITEPAEMREAPPRCAEKNEG